MTVNGRPRSSAVYRVEVALKPGVNDPAGAALKAQLPALGIQAACEARVCALYEITGPFSPGQIQAAAQELLADPITQDFFLNGSGTANGSSAPRWRIEVWLKPSVTDAAGESVRKAVTDLGLPPPDRVRCGQVVRLTGRLTQAQVERIALRLLANPVVHDFSVAPA